MPGRCGSGGAARGGSYSSSRSGWYPRTTGPVPEGWRGPTERTKDQPTQPRVCVYESKAVTKCIKTNINNVAECDYNVWNECKAQSVNSTTAPRQHHTACAYDTQAFNECIKTNGGKVAACQFYYNTLQACKQISNA